MMSQQGNNISRRQLGIRRSLVRARRRKRLANIRNIDEERRKALAREITRKRDLVITRTRNREQANITLIEQNRLQSVIRGRIRSDAQRARRNQLTKPKREFRDFRNIIADYPLDNGSNFASNRIRLITPDSAILQNPVPTGFGRKTPGFVSRFFRLVGSSFNVQIIEQSYTVQFFANVRKTRNNITVTETLFSRWSDNQPNLHNAPLRGQFNPRPSRKLRAPTGDAITRALRGYINDVKQNYGVTFISAGISHMTMHFQFSPRRGLLTPDNIRRLKAFSPSYDNKFNLLALVTATDSNRCIFEAYYASSWITNDMRGLSEFKAMNNKVQNNGRRNKRDFMDMLFNDLPLDLKALIIKGELINSISGLCKFYGNEILLTYIIDGNKFESECSMFYSDGTSNIVELNEIIDQYLLDSEPQKIPILIYKNSHLAVTTLKRFMEYRDKKLGTGFVKQQINSSLSPIEVTDEMIAKEDMIYRLVFDIETILVPKKVVIGGNPTTQYKHVPFCLSVYGQIQIEDREYIEETYYGLDCVNQFVDLVISLMDKSSITKSNNKSKIPKIVFYSHNGSKFDMLFVYKVLKDVRGLNIKAIIKSTSNIPSISFNNISFRDLCLIRGGKLRDLARQYNVQHQKTYFPYMFPTLDNFDSYIGPIPEQGWNNGERNKFMELNPNVTIFNLRSVTEEYCMQDCKSLYGVVNMVMNELTGIDSDTNKLFDCRKAITSSGASMTFFKQVGLQHKIYALPLKLQAIAKEAYYGGLTGNCKLHVSSPSWYFDINSSYPHAMTEPIPIAHKAKLIEYDEEYVCDDDDIFIRHNMYYVKVLFYDSNVIPNLPVRSKYGRLYQPLNQTDKFRWRYGVELDVTQSNYHCLILCKAMLKLKTESLFQTMIITKYNRRNKVKQDINKLKTKLRATVDEDERDILTEQITVLKSESNMIKLTMNGLYGKFGQRKFATKKLIKSDDLLLYLRKLKFDMKSITNLTIFYNDELGVWEVEYYSDEEQIYNPGNFIHIAAYITAVARSNLCNFMSEVGFDNVIYYDTDSVIFKSDTNPSQSRRLSNMLHPSNLGMWSNELGEGNMISEIITLGPKMYTYYSTSDNKWHNHMKGIPTHLLCSSHYNDIVEGEEHTYTLPTMWNRSNMEIYTRINVNRCVRRQLAKRIFDEEGNSIAIYNIGQE